MSVSHCIDSARVIAGVPDVMRLHRRSRSNLEGYQSRRLRSLVTHAYERVPYYRIAFDAHGVHPRDVRSIEDVCALPLTTKKDIQAASHTDLLARGLDLERLIERRTTGSTGQPLRICRTWFEERLLGLFRWRILAALGWRPTDRHVDVEEPVPQDANDRTIVHRVLQKAGLGRQLRINAFHEPEELLNLLHDAKPNVLTGYGGVLARVARVALTAGSETPRPHLIAVHSDTFTRQMRSAIETGFQAPVYEIYDANEANVIAWQCKQTHSLHTSDCTTLVEVLVDGRRAQPGERGEVVLTALHSYAMPLIRYRIGDLAIQGSQQCDCGLPFSTIRAIQGRMFDYFPLADGRTIHPYEIINVLNEVAPWIMEYRVIQQRRDLVRLHFVSQESPSANQVTEMRHAVGTLLGPQVEFEEKQVKQLEFEGSAKLRVCRSMIASEYDCGGDDR